MPSRIEDHALIADRHTVALVGGDGSIDWLHFPRFDSGSCFAALLNTPEHGRWLLAPAEESGCWPRPMARDRRPCGAQEMHPYPSIARSDS